MDMEVPLGSRVNVRDVLEMLDVIDSTRFQGPPNSRRDQTSRSFYYHPGLAGRGAAFVYYNTHRRQNFCVIVVPHCRSGTTMTKMWNAHLVIRLLIIFHTPIVLQAITSATTMPVRRLSELQKIMVSRSRRRDAEY